jgi:hypothetical protein
LVVDIVRTGCRCVETPDDIHKGRLTRAGWTHESHVVVRLDIQIDAVDGAYRLTAHVKKLTNTAHTDEHRVVSAIAAPVEIL